MMKPKFQVELSDKLEDTIEQHLSDLGIPTKREYLAALVSIADVILDAMKEGQELAFISDDTKEFRRVIIPPFERFRRDFKQRKNHD
jgi:hypothetical protein